MFFYLKKRLKKDATYRVSKKKEKRMQCTGAVTGGTTVLIPFMDWFPFAELELMSTCAGTSKMFGSGATGADIALAPPLW